MGFIRDGLGALGILSLPSAAIEGAKALGIYRPTTPCPKHSWVKLESHEKECIECHAEWWKGVIDVIAKGLKEKAEVIRCKIYLEDCMANPEIYAAMSDEQKTQVIHALDIANKYLGVSK